MLRNVGSYFLVNVPIPILTFLFEGSSQLWVSRSVLCERLWKKNEIVPVGESLCGGAFRESCG